MQHAYVQRTERKKERIKNTFFFSFRRVEILCVYQSVYGGRVRTVTSVRRRWQEGGGRLRWHVPLPPVVGRQSVRFSLSLSLSFFIALILLRHSISLSPSLSVSLRPSFLYARARPPELRLLLLYIFLRVGRRRRRLRIIIIIFYYNHDRVRPRTRTYRRPYYNNIIQVITSRFPAVVLAWLAFSYYYQFFFPTPFFRTEKRMPSRRRIPLCYRR